MAHKSLLEVNNLTTVFPTSDGEFRAVDQVSFTVDPGETLCVVGESGCGKSVTSLSIMRLFAPQSNVHIEGEVLLDGVNLLGLSAEQMRQIRGKELSMIFQEPMTSLNPVFTVGRQIAEAILNHEKMSKKEAFRRAVEMLEQVGIPDPESRAHDYPHQLSGGMRQRVMTAMALVCRPKLLIADEPTTALDVTIQVQILQLIKDLQASFETSVILITHDLGVVADMADRVLIMYCGEVVEMADVYSVFSNPLHPYTEGLLSSVPGLDSETKYLSVIKGTLPSPQTIPPGCKFQPRCPYATDLCASQRPPLKTVKEGHMTACWHAEELSLKGVEPL